MNATRELKTKTKAKPSLKEESERIIAVVDARRRAVETRLDIIELAGQDALANQVVRDEVHQTLDSAARLLAIVEGWYQAR